MALNWQKWGRDFVQSLGRHIGTAGMTWLGLGLKDGVINWGSLWIALLLGAVLPTVFTFLQKTPLPDDIESITVTTATVETVTKKPDADTTKI